MCDYSLQQVKSRAAQVADKLVTRDFGRGTVGFSDLVDAETAVCVLPGTEMAFSGPIKQRWSYGALPEINAEYRTAIFRQKNKDQALTHHDCLEFPDGQTVMLNGLAPGQKAVVLQLPATPKTVAEAEDQRRVEVVG